jgi:predicted O-methyltransferase YrrM
LWLASAARANGGIVTTIEQSDYKAGLARKTFDRSGMDSSITLIQDDAGRVLERSSGDAFDFVFLDADRSQYSAWWPHLNRVLRPGGLLVADNATSHADQMAPLVSLLKSDPAYTVCIVPMGKGELLAVTSKP